MFYAGAYNNEPQQIGVAVSDDGIAWTRLWDEPLLPNGAPGSWNESEWAIRASLWTTMARHTCSFRATMIAAKVAYLSRLRVRWTASGLPYLEA